MDPVPRIYWAFPSPKFFSTHTKAVSAQSTWCFTDSFTMYYLRF